MVRWLGFRHRARWPMSGFVVLDRGPMTPPASTLRWPDKAGSSTVLFTRRDDAWKSAARTQTLVNVTAICAWLSCAPGLSEDSNNDRSGAWN
jgi:hypothetical protein